MKKTFQKTLIAAATGVALLSAVGTANANSLLFPYFTTEAGNTSIVSLSTNNGSAPTGEQIHYVYNYGSGCTHFDGFGKMTNNDLLQHSVASVAAGGFGKVVATDGSTPFYFPLKDYGFLTVTTRTTATAKISGDMIVYNPAAGIVTSYPAIDNGILDTATTPATTEGNFVNITDTLFNLSFYPTDLVTTSWYAVVAGDMSANISANTDWAGTASLANGGLVYDNDEAPNSGAKSAALKCAGVVKPSDLMNTAQAATVGPKGGLIHATATPVAPATGVVMTKIQILTGTKAGLLHREQAPAF